MNRKKTFTFLGVLCVVASVVMYLVGNDSSHLSELKDFFWIPLPLAGIFFLVSSPPKKA